MDIEGRSESSNIEDRRGEGGGGFGGFGGGGGFGGFGGGGGLGRLALGGGGGIVAVIFAVILGVLQQYGGGAGGRGLSGGGGGGDPPPNQDKLKHFVGVVFGDTERVWDEQFRRLNEKDPKSFPLKTYPRPKLVLFSGQVNSGCGTADAAVGPFYCPEDQKVYIDLSFYHEMDTKLGAGGDFAHAYVIAHEVGHHVQGLLFPDDVRKVNEARQRSKAEANRMSVRLELQADYLAGVWAHYGQEKYKFIQPGDIDSALNAAYQIGDDRLQKKARGTVVPDSFTHGTSAQRQKWFKKGFETGDINGARELFRKNYDDL